MSSIGVAGNEDETKLDQTEHQASDIRIDNDCETVGSVWDLELLNERVNYERKMGNTTFVAKDRTWLCSLSGKPECKAVTV
jgi:hypothetical protein